LTTPLPAAAAALPLLADPVDRLPLPPGLGPAALFRGPGDCVLVFPAYESMAARGIAPADMPALAIWPRSLVVACYTPGGGGWRATDAAEAAAMLATAPDKNAALGASTSAAAAALASALPPCFTFGVWKLIASGAVGRLRLRPRTGGSYYRYIDFSSSEDGVWLQDDPVDGPQLLAAVVTAWPALCARPPPPPPLSRAHAVTLPPIFEIVAELFVEPGWLYFYPVPPRAVAAVVVACDSARVHVQTSDGRWYFG
jgi:hypothetical protein